MQKYIHKMKCYATTNTHVIDIFLSTKYINNNLLGGKNRL